MITPKYFPFRNGVWKFEVGLHPINVHQWFDLDEHYADDLREKRVFKEKFRYKIFAEISESLDSQKEAADLISSLVFQTPFLYGEADSPLDIVGEHVQEDLCIMSHTDRGWILTAGSVYFPSFWNLLHKLGNPMSFIHELVPKWNKRIGDVISARMNNMSSGIPFERFNWTITTESQRFQPEGERTYRLIEAKDVGDNVFMRVERQILYKLENTKDILFTIRTYLYPLGYLKTFKTLEESFVSSVLSCDDETLAYKGILLYKDAILEYFN